MPAQPPVPILSVRSIAAVPPDRDSSIFSFLLPKRFHSTPICTLATGPTLTTELGAHLFLSHQTTKLRPTPSNSSTSPRLIRIIPFRYYTLTVIRIHATIPYVWLNNFAPAAWPQPCD